jgi:hypothetical protein
MKRPEEVRRVDAAIHYGDRARMIGLLAHVDLADQAEEIADTLLAQHGRIAA